MRKPVWAANAAVALSIVLAPRPSDACSCGYPCEHEFLPPLQAGAIPLIPQNGGVVWRIHPGNYASPTIEPSSWISIQRVEADALVDVDAEVTELGGGALLVKPATGPWEVGARYRVSIDIPKSDVHCAADVLQAVHEVIAGPPLTDEEPTELYVQDQRVQRVTVEAGASCDQTILAAQTRVSFSSAGGPPFHDYYGSIFTRTTVDDQPWEPRESLCSRHSPGATWTGRMSDRLFAGCDGEHGLTEGTHEVQLHLELPGSSWSYSSERLEFTLDCGDAGSPGSSADDVGTTETPGDVEPDRTQSADGADMGGMDEAPTGTPPDGRGCGGCAVAGTAVPVFPLLLAVLFLSASIITSRRRTSRRGDESVD